MDRPVTLEETPGKSVGSRRPPFNPLDPGNEARVFEALRSLPDRAVDQLDPGDVARYAVVRVNDEITVDLMGCLRSSPPPLADEEIDPPREGLRRPPFPPQVV